MEPTADTVLDPLHPDEVAARRLITTHRPDLGVVLASCPWAPLRAQLATDPVWVEALRAHRPLWAELRTDAVLGGVLGEPPGEHVAAAVRDDELRRSAVLTRRPPREVRDELDAARVRWRALDAAGDVVFTELVAQRLGPAAAAALGPPDGTLRPRLAPDESWVRFLCTDLVVARFAYCASTFDLTVPLELSIERWGTAGVHWPRCDTLTAAQRAEFDAEQQRRRGEAAASVRRTRDALPVMSPGEVWFARPSRVRSDGTGPQEHPVVVLADNGDDHDVWCVRFTSSQSRADDDRYLAFEGEWVAATGRDRSFAAVADAPESVARATFRRKVGVLPPADWARLVAALDGRVEALHAALGITDR